MRRTGKKLNSKWSQKARDSWLERRRNNMENSSTTFCDKTISEGRKDRICGSELSKMWKINENV